MARTLKKKPRLNAGNEGSVGAKTAANAFNRVENTLQIQELQNLMDSQKTKTEAIKAAYAQQNSQLAKSNSSLMMRLSDLEKKISELVQENLSLRSIISMSEFKYKERLGNQLQLLEEGISSRVDEIFYMFDSIRKKENLPKGRTSRSASEVKSILRNKACANSSYSSRNSAHNIQFADIHDEIMDSVECNELNENTGDQLKAHDEEKIPRKKRKSSRRESIFLPNDFDFSGAQEAECIREPALEADSQLESGVFNDQNQIENTEVQDSVLPNVDIHDSSEQPEDAHGEGSFNFTNSIIEYSIPEETLGAMTSSEMEQMSSSKIEVFKDEPVAPTRSQGEEDLSATNNTTFIPLPLQNKVKHSMRPPNSRPRKNMVDEVMPSSGNGTGPCDIDFSRSRRTRGKAIDYTLPSLRAKMRRPSEKLVDATTFTSIHDLQVKKISKRYGKSHASKSNAILKLKESVAPTASSDLHADRNDMIPTTKNITKDLGIRDVSNSSNSPEQPILKDITNRPRSKVVKTRKLFKNAIINDICDSNLKASDELFNSSSSGSFRLNEDDLSVFDLIGTNKIKHPHKTYRAKSKK